MAITQEETQKEAILQHLKRCKGGLFNKYGIKKLGVFGSVVPDDSDEPNYVDILVSFKNGVGVEIFDLEDELEKVLDRKVMILSRSTIEKKYYRKIKSDLEYV